MKDIFFPEETSKKWVSNGSTYYDWYLLRPLNLQGIYLYQNYDASTSINHRATKTLALFVSMNVEGIIKEEL